MAGYDGLKLKDLVLCLYIWSFTAVNLAVDYPPKFTYEPTVPDILVPRNRFSLSCRATGVPDPEYQWLKNDNPISNFTLNEYYHFEQIHKDDEGSYKCIARNRAGALISKIAKIRIAHLSLTSNVSSQIVSARAGRAIIISPSLINSVPEPTVIWSKDGQDLNVNSEMNKYFVTKSGQLVISNVSPSDAGSYQMKVTNQLLGEQIKSGLYQLQVQNNTEEVELEIVVSPNDTIAYQGDFSAIMECVASAKALDRLDIKWFRAGQEVYTDNGFYVLTDRRKLTIAHPSTQSEGVYECSVGLLNASVERMKATASLTFYSKPVITRPPNPTTEVSLGQNVQVPCSAQGTPNPVVVWYKDAVDILNSSDSRFAKGDNGNLLINKVQMKDSGNLQCIASNIVGESIAVTYLKVKGMVAMDRILTTSPNIVEWPQNISAVEGVEARLPCTAVGSPEPEITWMLNDTTPLKSSGRIQVLPNGALLITTVSRTDSGKYTCVASNSLGNINSSAYVFINVRTHITHPPVDASVIMSTTAYFNCGVFHEDHVVITRHWFFGRQVLDLISNSRIGIYSNGTLVIREVRSDDKGQYTCQVTSEGGNDTKSAMLNVIELPHAPTSVLAVLAPNSSKTVNISWAPGFDGNSPIIKYIIQYRIVPNEGPIPDTPLAWNSLVTDHSANRRWIINSSLRPATSYQFRVSAVSKVGEGEASEPSNKVTLRQEAPSAAPRNVMASGGSSTTIMIQWEPPPEDKQNGDIRGYHVRYKLAGYGIGIWSSRNITNENQRNFIIKDLIVWKEYEIQMAAYNDMGVGVYGESVRARTKEGVPSAPPTEVDATAINSTAIRVSWKPPDPQKINGINQGYKVLALREDKALTTYTFPPSPVDQQLIQTEYLTRLQKYTEYNIVILCYTNPGDGERSVAVKVRTKPDVPDAVGFFRFLEVLYHSVKLEWSPPKNINGILLGYTLNHFIKGQQTNTLTSKNLTANITNYEVVNLTANTEYTFEIFAWTEVGHGPPLQETVRSGLPPKLPGSPTRLAISNVRATSVVLQFVPGYNGSTSISKWSVEAQRNNNRSWFVIFEITAPDAESFTVESLKPFSEYRLRLTANNVVGNSPPSEPTEVFQTLHSPPGMAPGNVTVRVVDSKSLRVRWTPLQQEYWNGYLRGYNVSFNELSVDAPSRHILIEDVQANSFILSDLEEWTDYQVTVAAYNDVGIGPWSPIKHAKTQESVPSAGPDTVNVTATSSTTISVTWDRVPRRHQNGILLGYKVNYGAVGIPYKNITVPGNESFSVTLMDLKKFINYNILVMAFTRVGDGTPSEPVVTAKTFEDIPGPPSNILFPDVTTTMARVIWEPPKEPNGIILGYKVAYRLNESKPEDIVINDQLRAETRTYTAKNLEPQQTYIFTLAANTSKGWGEATHVYVKTITNRKRPEAPTKPQISPSQVQARQLTFSVLPNGDGYSPIRYYEIEFMREDYSDWFSRKDRIPPDATEYTVTGLTPNNRYIFRIRAVNDIGESAWSLNSDVVQTLLAAPDIPPEDLQVRPYTVTSVLLIWKIPPKETFNGNLQGFGIFYRQLPESIGYQDFKYYEPQKTKYFLQNLVQDKTYEIKMTCFNSQGHSPPTSPVTVYIGEAVPSGEPIDIEVKPLNMTELKVTWLPPLDTEQNGEILGYKIFYWKSHKPGQELVENVAGQDREVILSNLTEYTQYSVQVVAYNAAGDGPRIRVVTANTMPGIPGPPGELEFTDITMTTLIVRWTPPKEPNGEIISYLVQYHTITPGEFTVWMKWKVNNTEYAVRNLVKLATYTFEVRAETIQGKGPPSIGNVTTGPQHGSPSSPSRPVLTRTSSSVTLTWTNGDEGASPLIGYIIEWARDGEETWEMQARTSKGPMTAYAISFLNLVALTRYQFRVISYNKFGISMPSPPSDTLVTPKLSPTSENRPFYLEKWFLIVLAALGTIIIIMIVACLCIKSKTYKYKEEAQKASQQDERMSMDDGGFATFELRQSHGGALRKKDAVLRKSKSPPRPSPAGVTYSDDETVCKYSDDGGADSSSLTEKPSDLDETTSQETESDFESDAKSDPHSFVNHYANVNDTLRQSWKKQKPAKAPSYTDSDYGDPGSAQLSLNGGHIILNNMAGSRQPLPGFSSFV